MPDITITGDDAVLKALAQIDLAALAPVIGAAVAAEAQRRLATYPAAAHKKQPFKSTKQRRFFFAALHDGRISVPYRRGTDPRSQTLGRKWSITPDGDGATLVNTAGYAELVQGERQAAYHRGVWPSVVETAEAMVSDGSAQSIGEAAVLGAIRKAGLE